MSMHNLLFDSYSDGILSTNNIRAAHFHRATKEEITELRRILQRVQSVQGVTREAHRAQTAQTLSSDPPPPENAHVHLPSGRQCASCS